MRTLTRERQGGEHEHHAVDMTVLNDLDRFHLVMDVIDRVPQTGEAGRALKSRLQAKLIEHKRTIDQNGQELPEIRNWKWGAEHTDERK